MSGPAHLDEQARSVIAAGAAAIAISGMVPGSAGNVSVRGAHSMLITPSGAELRVIDPADVVEVGLSDGEVAPGHASNSRPSSETGLHRAIYAATDAGAVVHTHAHHATVIGTLVDELPAIHYAIAAFGGPVRVARYETFGTDALAGAVVEALEGRAAALMANHGAVVLGRSVEHAVALALQLEWLSTVYYRALVAGTPRILTEQELDAVREQAAALRYGVQVPV